MKCTGGYIEQPEDEVRCECGQLLLKLTAEGLELKCRRCKRIRLLPWRSPPPAAPRKKIGRMRSTVD
jgi:phage FluMu protein Com